MTAVVAETRLHAANGILLMGSGKMRLVETYCQTGRWVPMQLKSPHHVKVTHSPPNNVGIIDSKTKEEDTRNGSKWREEEGPNGKLECNARQ